MVKEIAKQMPFVMKGSKAMGSQDPIVKVMDYKTEMCLMIDNISNVEVFRSIDVDMPDNYISNLQVTQIQRLMKIKTELQSASPDMREIQLTLKRFIVDLDVKEAYEFYILNTFLINEEELNNLLAEVSREENASSGFRKYNSNSKETPLELHAHADDDSNSDNHEDNDYMPPPQKQGGKRVRKSLMHVDLDRMAADALTKGEQHFSFNNNQMLGGGGGMDQNNFSRKEQQLNMIKEGENSFEDDMDEVGEDEYQQMFKQQ